MRYVLQKLGFYSLLNIIFLRTCSLWVHDMGLGVKTDVEKELTDKEMDLLDRQVKLSLNPCRKIMEYHEGTGSVT
jgi:hypothetical protein